MIDITIILRKVLETKMSTLFNKTMQRWHVYVGIDFLLWNWIFGGKLFPAPQKQVVCVLPATHQEFRI